MKNMVFNIDCMEGIANVKPGTFGLGLLDTQYGIGEDGRKSASRTGAVKQKNGTGLIVKSNHAPAGWDKEVMPVEYWLKVREITAYQVIFGINYIQANIPYVSMDWGFKPPRRHEYDEFLRRNPAGFIIWDKCNGGSDFADCEVLWVSHLMPSFVKYFMWSGMMQAKSLAEPTTQQGNKALNQKRIHPTEKPLELSKWLIDEYAPAGFPILDTHAGSQIFRIAAYQMGFDYIGFETNVGYFDAGCKRFDLITSQQSLFGQTA